MTETDEFGRTAPHYVAADGDLTVAQRLVGSENVNAADHYGWAPLHFAAHAAHPRSVTGQLPAGAAIDAATTNKGIPRTLGPP